MEGNTISKPNRHILIDKASRFKQSKFHITKGAIIPDMCQYMHSEKERGYPIQILRQDNAKENMALIKIAKGKDWKHNFKTEMTARNTSQQNLNAEMAFPVIAAQARSMLISAQIPDGERFKLWPEVTVTATFLNNLVPVTVNGETKTRWEHTGHKILLWVKVLLTFGEAGTVKEGKKGKVLDRGITMIFVGYDNEHNGNCYRIYNPVTSRVVITRAVIWLGRMFYTRLAHKLDHKSMPVVLVSISMNACNIKDKSAQTLEVITRIVPASASDERGGATIDLSEKANAKWATYRTRSSRVIKHKSGMHNLETGQTIKWTDMVTVVDEDEYFKNYYNVLGIYKSKERVFDDSGNKFIKFVNVGAGIGGGFSNTLKSFES
jgi:hypothetical protein